MCVIPRIARLLATRINMTTLCLVPSMAASQAHRSSWLSALDFAIAGGGGATLGGSQSDSGVVYGKIYISGFLGF
ncbi:hypothetical protein ACFXTO_025457 [Malus domestica]